MTQSLRKPGRVAVDPTLLAPAELRAGRPFAWLNPDLRPGREALAELPVGRKDLDEAERDWAGFAPDLARLFPDLARTGGRVTSPLIDAGPGFAARIPGAGGGSERLLIKCDHQLAPAGSIKARGGFYEVLVHARERAAAAGLGDPDRTDVLTSPEARACFSRFRIVAGSTGNLGYGIGLIGRALNFQVEIHMSADARQWKKDRLRALGARVVEHSGDYGEAVAGARQSARQDASAYFVDDEDSLRLFMGYAAAAFELEAQLAAIGIRPSAQAPLVVYLPCGVGGAPGGIAFGLKHLFGDAVMPVLVEPVASPCMLVQCCAGPGRRVSVYELGLDNRTEADGLAVASASMLAYGMIRHLIAGIVTVDDDSMFRWLATVHDRSGLRLEPSAAAGFAAIRPFVEASGIKAAAHIVWTTGGGALPDALFAEFLGHARRLSQMAEPHSTGAGRS